MKGFKRLVLLVIVGAGCTGGSAGYPGDEGEPAVVLRVMAADRAVPGDGHFEPEADEFWVIERGMQGGNIPMSPPKGGELRTTFEGKEVPLPLKHTDVKAKIALHIASVTLTQQYHNPFAGKIEAVYLFPLPQNAAVTDFLLKIGDRTIRGIIREREEARRIYEAARAQGYVAALFSQERPNIFTQSVANIEPGKAIDVQISYFHTLRLVGGDYEFVFPMVVGPRFNPPGSTDGVGAVGYGAHGSSGQKTEVAYLRPREISAHDISLSVEIESGIAMKNLASPTHAIEIDRTGPAAAKVTLKPGDTIPNKDFILRYRLGGDRVRGGLVTHRDAESGYFTLLLQPPENVDDIPMAAREMIFVVDCSGSMSGEPLSTAKRVIRRALKKLGRNDTFQIMRFSDRVTPMVPAPVRATPINVKKGLRYVDGLRADGGTMMIRGIHAALDYPADSERRRIVTFLTDGYIGNEAQILEAVHEKVGDARIFSFGIGSSVNRYLLERIAALGRGTAAFVTLDESSQRSVERLYEEISKPALSDISIDWGDLNAEEIYPAKVPDVFVGRPVIVTGRCKFDGEASVTLRGRIGGRPYETVMRVRAGGSSYPALGKLWARAKIMSLHDRLLSGAGDSGNLARTSTQVALRHGLVSAFTSFVAVDSMRVTDGDHGTTVQVPVPVPAGVKYETAVGKPQN